MKNFGKDIKQLDLDEIKSIERNDIATDLTKGVATMLFSSILGTVIAMLIVMTPDPDGLIHYRGAAVILIVLFITFLYGVKKVTDVEKFLKKGS